MTLLIAGASAGVAGRVLKPSGSDKLIEGVWESGQIGELAGRGRLVLLAVAIDPDRLQPELVRRNDVVVVALGDVHVSVTGSARLFEELQPVPVPRFVRVDLRRDDRKLEGNADSPDRRLDEVAVGVREERKLPAARARLVEGRGNLRKRAPLREGGCEPALLALRCAECRHRVGHHLPVASSAPGLQRRLELVVALELRVGTFFAEDARELTADAAVPVDQRAVAIERRPTLSGHTVT